MIYDPPFVTASEPVIVGAVMLLLSIVMMVAGFIWKKKPKKK
jgi:hypothetical protein